jgi:predicted dinucleotide-binding enzyme
MRAASDLSRSCREDVNSTNKTKEHPTKIGIIGAGNIGATLARKLAAIGHEVKLANSKGPDTIRAHARDIGATAVSKEEAVQGVAVIVLAIPFGRYPDLTGLLIDVPADVAVLDTSNYYPFRDGTIAEVDGGKPESVWVSEQISRPVVKVWNAVLAVTLAERGQPNGASGRIAIPVAGDAPKAKATAIQLVDATGFGAVDFGSLSDSWRQQPGTPAYCTELTADDLKSVLHTANRSRAPGNRDALLKEFMAAGGKLTHDEIVTRNRAVTA